MNISEAARCSGLSSKAIRFYEEKGLLSAVERTANGYRNYNQQQVEMLCFIRRARGLGFSLEECRQLLALQGQTERRSAEVKARFQNKLARIRAQIARLQAQETALLRLTDTCPGNHDAHCPILDQLNGVDKTPVRNL
ncbi:Cu(I)-responsive transcriptional regulator [Neptuniibacter halophilus]|uniref:Cu(I)-responsive transcriptional regulator n=1 Tax=Neptuniibacter halophilus TaxID=651666 RepID=UPI002572E89F|nr:Cu(I)-responsive transcriptional regulator [Neptuniibacter halophilus]